MDYSPPGFFVHGILQARILEWVAISSTMQIHSILLQSEGANLAKGIRSIKVRSVKLAHEDLQLNKQMKVKSTGMTTWVLQKRIV